MWFNCSFNYYCGLRVVLKSTFTRQDKLWSTRRPRKSCTSKQDCRLLNYIDTTRSSFLPSREYFIYDLDLKNAVSALLSLPNPGFETGKMYHLRKC